MMMRVKVEPNIPTPPHSHTHEQMGIILEGEGTLSIGDESVHIVAGTSFLVPSNVPHNFDATGKVPAVLIECFTPNRLDYLKQVGMI